MITGCWTEDNNYFISFYDDGGGNREDADNDIDYGNNFHNYSAIMMILMVVIMMIVMMTITALIKITFISVLLLTKVRIKPNSCQ